MTKRENDIYNSYVRSSTTSLFQAYKKPSQAKEHGWWRCRDLCAKFNGYDLKILGYNCFMFSAAFLFDDNGYTHLMYITKNDIQVFIIR